MKTFNTTGKCIPSLHYMVDISHQVEAAAQLVRGGNYFCINRGRQFGKTTTLSVLKNKLDNEGYSVFSLSFEGLDDEVFSSLSRLLYVSMYMMQSCVEWGNVHNLSEESAAVLREFKDSDSGELSSMKYSKLIGTLCMTSKVVVFIDEVDYAGNHQEFVQFLGLLRENFLNRDNRPAYQSVVLAGVYDVKNLKLKLRPDCQHQYNSPWNIAVPFDTDMCLPAQGIADMLSEYMSDHKLQFDNISVARMIFDYTSGYPFLVSRICQIIDTCNYSWDKDGVLRATHDLLVERNTLFDDMVKKLTEYPQLKDLLKAILFEGKKRSFYTDEKYLQIGVMFNFIKNDYGNVAIVCRLVETRLYNLFIGENETARIFDMGQQDKNSFICDGHIDMRLLFERFCWHFNEIYNPEKDEEFLERNGRMIFLTYLRPIINGVGNYYCEAQTRDMTRTDVIIDYLGKQYVVELKIWRGNAYNERGEKQLSDYLDYYNLNTGYMISFCFNKNKKSGINEVVIGDKIIIEAIV